MKVTLANYDSNRIRKRVGFSWLYFFFGPFYLIARLHFEGILLAVIYYYLLPIPGMNYIAGWIGSWGISSQAAETVSQILLFFRSGWNHIEVYLGLILFLSIHLMMSYIGGSCVLRRTIKRKKLAPVTEDDARQLIKWHCVKADVLLSDEIAERLHLHDQAEEIWQENNMTYTSMLSKSAISHQEAGRNRKMSAETKYNTEVRQRTGEEHARNSKMLLEGKISKDEYEILEQNMH